MACSELFDESLSPFWRKEIPRSETSTPGTPGSSRFGSGSPGSTTASTPTSAVATPAAESGAPESADEDQAVPAVPEGWGGALFP